MSKPVEPKQGEPIKLLKLGRPDSSGRDRYCYKAICDVGSKTERKQQRKTLSTITEARKWIRDTKSANQSGSYTAPSTVTFDQLADSYVTTKKLEVREKTLMGYKESLAYSRAAFGSRPVQDITRDDVLLLRNDMAESKSLNTAKGVLLHLRAVLERGIDDEVIHRNVARNVKAKGAAAKPKRALSAKEREAIHDVLEGEFLEGPYRLTLRGLRRSEVMALRWSDISDGVLTISKGRVLVGASKTVEGDPKSLLSNRQLPLDKDTLTALKRCREFQISVLGFKHGRTGYMAVKIDGTPERPELYSDKWREYCRQAKVPVVTLHEARHTSTTLMRNADVPSHKTAAWHGHTEDISATIYTHPSVDDMKEASEAV